MEGWSVTRLAWQVIAVPVQLDALASARAPLAAGAGGLTLFGATAPADLGRQLSGLIRASGGAVAPLVMADVEGGDVERAANLVGPMPSARSLAQTMTPAGIRAFAEQAGRRMRAAGITMDLAPVLDLDSAPGPVPGDPDGTRSFSAVPAVASADALAFAQGLAAAGVIAAAKHFPGLHGRGDDTDAGPAVTAPWSALQTSGLVPFTAAVRGGVPAIMLSNAVVPGLTTLPASVSSAAVAVLRDQMGFRGLIVTDSLSAGALSAIGLSVARAAVAALGAGADMVLYSGAPSAAWGNAMATAAAIEDAVASGHLARARLVDAVAGVLAAKHVDPCAAAAR